MGKITKDRISIPEIYEGVFKEVWIRSNSSYDEKLIGLLSENLIEEDTEGKVVLDAKKVPNKPIGRYTLCGGKKR